MISFIAKLIVTLNSNSRPGELASGIAFGFWLALIPGGSLLWTALFIIAFFLKHNIAALLFSLGIFKLFIFIFDPLLDRLGLFVLELPPLQSFFTMLNNVPLVPYTQFNNTIVMGGFLLGILLWVPVFIVFLLLIKVYRKKAAPRIAESRLIKGLKKVPLISKIISAAEKAAVLV